MRNVDIRDLQARGRHPSLIMCIYFGLTLGDLTMIFLMTAKGAWWWRRILSNPLMRGACVDSPPPNRIWSYTSGVFDGRRESNDGEKKSFKLHEHAQIEVWLVSRLIILFDFVNLRSDWRTFFECPRFATSWLSMSMMTCVWKKKKKKYPNAKSQP